MRRSLPNFPLPAARRMLGERRWQSKRAHRKQRRKKEISEPEKLPFVGFARGSLVAASEWRPCVQDCAEAGECQPLSMHGFMFVCHWQAESARATPLMVLHRRSLRLRSQNNYEGATAWQFALADIAC